MQKQIEQTISSVEVARMVEKQHKNLLADIRGYMEELLLLENQESNSRLKIQPRDYFRESLYISRGKEYLCFDVTKKGCEFIAHKLTGIKGTEFTARYINRFHDMEDVIKDGIPQKDTRGDNHKVQIPSPVNTAAKILKDTYCLLYTSLQLLFRRQVSEAFWIIPIMSCPYVQHRMVN